AFAGIQVLSLKVFDLMKNRDAKFPIMDFYLSNMKNEVISGFVPDNFRMMDVGKLDVLEEAEKFVRTPNP
ncbi:MAG: nucleotidyltransferase family protein, partial [Paludibacter sp.]